MEAVRGLSRLHVCPSASCTRPTRPCGHPVRCVDKDKHGHSDGERSLAKSLDRSHLLDPGSHVCMVDVQRYLLSVNMNQLWWGGAKAGAVPRELFYDCVEKERMKVPGVNHPIHHMKVRTQSLSSSYDRTFSFRPSKAECESSYASAPIHLCMRAQVLFRVVQEDVVVGPGELAAWLYLGSHNLSKSAVRHMPAAHY